MQPQSSRLPSFTDQLGRTIVLQQIPRRIISLVPSQTELLYSLGLDNEVVGITKFCVHPSAWFRHKTLIGGTKNIHPERIALLKPDLIIANKEENDQRQVEDLAARYPVWVSDIHTLTGALAMIRAIGTITGRDQQAHSLATDIESRFAALSPTPVNAIPLLHTPANAISGPRTAYFIWRNPWMAAGGDTFIHDMLLRCGFTNVFAAETRYPVVDLETLARSNCETILLSSEPYPFKEKHIREIQEILPETTIRLVDGEPFSWYGSRLLEAPAYFALLRQEQAKYPQ